MGGSVAVLLFASAREAVGRPRVTVPVDGSTLSVAELLDTLAQSYPRLPDVLRHSRLVLNGSYIESTSARVRPGDELAIHPPYSGG